MSFGISPEAPQAEGTGVLGGKLGVQGARTANDQMADLHLQTCKQQIDHQLIDQLLNYELKPVNIGQLVNVAKKLLG